MKPFPILKMGDPKLQTPAKVVADFSDPHLQKDIAELKFAMKTFGGVGISAPQIGINKRIILFGFEHSARYPTEKPVPFTILINPTYTTLTEQQEESWEGCLSVPGLRGKVPRFTRIEYSAFNLDGNEIKIIAEGFHARIIQHECDHLDGVLFPERIVDMKNFGFEELLWEKIYGVPYPVSS